MNESNPPPESISYKKLKSILASTQENSRSTELKTNPLEEAQNSFKQLVLEWSLLSQKLIEELSKKSDYVIEGRNPKSIMALGALEAHLNMAIQAQKAADKE